MEAAAFVQGLFVGFFACSPIGPIGLLCIKRTLTHGRLAGLVSVLGASTVDGIYCCIAGFGITFIADVLERAHDWIQLVGGLLIAIIGIVIVLSEPPKPRNNSDKRGLIDAFLSAFLLTLANPIPLLVFTAAFAALGVPGWKGDYVAAGKLVSGVIIGSAIWAPILAFTAGMAAQRMDRMHLRMVNSVSGGIIAAFGSIVLLRTLTTCFAR
jgi:threonine/homoserine/homoserine lactone efflux protein